MSSSVGDIPIGLSPDMPASLAVRKILSGLFDVMEANEAGLLADDDTEFLHDFRIAVRRSRTALTRLKGILPEQASEHFRPEFAWLGDVTTPLRDLDVYLLNFDVYQSALPASMWADLEPLRQFLTQAPTGTPETG